MRCCGAYRDRAFVAGLVVALLVSIKLFVWPLGLWLLATRRYASFGYAALCGVALNLVGWSVLGFDQVVPYVKLLGLVSEHAETHAFGLPWLAVHYGATRSAALALTLALAAALGAACFLLGRRGRGQSALLLCIAMCFLATPVTWPHYWALLIVPLALLRPRLSLVWAIPVLLAPVAAVLSYWGTAAMVIGENAMVAAVVVAALRVPGLRISSNLRPETA